MEKKACSGILFAHALFLNLKNYLLTLNLYLEIEIISSTFFSVSLFKELFDIISLAILCICSNASLIASVVIQISQKLIFSSQTVR